MRCFFVILRNVWYSLFADNQHGGNLSKTRVIMYAAPSITSTTLYSPRDGSLIVSTWYTYKIYEKKINNIENDFLGMFLPLLFQNNRKNLRKKFSPNFEHASHCTYVGIVYIVLDTTVLIVFGHLYSLRPILVRWQCSSIELMSQARHWLALQVQSYQIRHQFSYV